MRERVLVVEDDPEMLDTCSEVLKRAGYEVVGAGSGRGAEEILRTSAVDVVITDLKMPRMSGQELFWCMEREWPELAQHTLFITGDVITIHQPFNP